MDITTMLAQLWGPVVLAVGLGVFMSRSHYLKVYRDLNTGAFAGFTFGMLAMTVGIAHIGAHNAWNTFREVVISLLGWALLVKGTMFVVFPGFVERAANKVANLRLIPFIGALMLVAGAYLCYIGYVA